MSSDQTRTWGYWSQAKLQILHEYLPLFLRASQTAKERIYIDAFAGAGHGVDRLSGEEFNGSARIALDAAAGPTRFTQLLYFEQEHLATNLEATLRAAYPGRNISVRGGDCNTELPSALKALASVRWAPTFAFIDPDGLEFRWDTLKALADHKRGYRSAAANKPEYKVELWILFSTQGLVQHTRAGSRKAPDHTRGARIRAVRDRAMATHLRAPTTRTPGPRSGKGRVRQPHALEADA